MKEELLNLIEQANDMKFKIETFVNELSQKDNQKAAGELYIAAGSLSDVMSEINDAIEEL